MVVMPPGLKQWATFCSFLGGTVSQFWPLDAPVEAGVWAGGGRGHGVQGVLARQGVAPQHLVQGKLQKEEGRGPAVIPTSLQGGQLLAPTRCVPSVNKVKICVVISSLLCLLAPLSSA